MVLKDMDHLCAVCRRNDHRYTCPRCSVKTCSLDCSASHKRDTSCTGIRDKAKYIPLNQYGWGKMADDYVFLEDIGRQVERWGRELASERTLRTEFSSRGRGMRKDQGFRNNSRKRKDLLCSQLGMWDIDMEVLPSGMDRHQRNQSTWDFKNQTALLTVEFKFHLQVGNKQRTLISILTHRNDFHSTLYTLVHKHARENAKLQIHADLLRWLNDLDDNGHSQPICLILSHRIPDPRINKNNVPENFDKIDWNTPLSLALRNKEFVEFPTFHIMAESFLDSFLPELEKSHIGATLSAPKGGKEPSIAATITNATIGSMLEGYGSDSDSS